MTTTIPTGNWVVDPSHSSVEFTVRHLMISKVKGSFADFTGTATVGEDPTQADIHAEVVIASVNTKDEGRDAHLRSPDFFDAEQYPAMVFKSTSIEPKTGNDFLLHGDLTIKGVTKPVTFKAEFGGVNTDPFGNTKAAVEASTKINRSDYGLTWNAALETGGVLVSEEVTIALDIQAVLQK